MGGTGGESLSLWIHLWYANGSDNEKRIVLVNEAGHISSALI